MTVTVSLTFKVDAEAAAVRPRLRDIMQGFSAAVPEADRLNSNVSIHEPPGVVVCVQEKDGRVSVWHDQADDPLRVAQEEATRLRDRNAYLEHALERADSLLGIRANREQADAES
jgi:hypothetical protein